MVPTAVCNRCVQIILLYPALVLWYISMDPYAKYVTNIRPAKSSDKAEDLPVFWCFLKIFRISDLF